MFENCTAPNHAALDNSTNDDNVQGETASYELAGCLISLACALLFYVEVVVQHVESRKQSPRPILVWDFPRRVHSIAFLVFVNACSFFISAQSEFRPWKMEQVLCTTQGVIYQFSFVGLMMEILAVCVEMWLVVVKMTPLDKLRSCKVSGSLFAMVYGVAILLAAIPLAIEQTQSVPLFQGSTLLGYCNIVIQTGCTAPALLFWIIPGWCHCRCTSQSGAIMNS